MNDKIYLIIIAITLGLFVFNFSSLKYKLTTYKTVAPSIVTVYSDSGRFVYEPNVRIEGFNYRDPYIGVLRISNAHDIARFYPESNLFEYDQANKILQLKKF